MRSRSMFVTSLLALGTLSTPAAALDNAGFDSGLMLWNNPFGYTAEWDPLDASNKPNSGSARVSNPLPGNGGTLRVLEQCTPMTANQAYRFGVSAQLLPGTPAGVAAEIVASIHANFDCSDTAIVSYFGPFTMATAWERIEGQVPAEAGSRWLRIWLGVSKPVGVDASVSARFDDVFLAAKPLFAVGFEPP